MLRSTLSSARSTWPPIWYSLLRCSICRSDMGSACVGGGSLAHCVAILEIAQRAVGATDHSLTGVQAFADFLVLVVGNTDFDDAPACHAVVIHEHVVLLDRCTE